LRLVSLKASEQQNRCLSSVGAGEDGIPGPTSPTGVKIDRIDEIRRPVNAFDGKSSCLVGQILVSSDNPTTDMYGCDTMLRITAAESSVDAMNFGQFQSLSDHVSPLTHLFHF
jgi:hypothetical protein